MTRRPDRKRCGHRGRLRIGANWWVSAIFGTAARPSYRERWVCCWTLTKLTVLGSKVRPVLLRGALVARLLSQSAWKQYPEHVDVAIKRPYLRLVERAGTTALHRLRRRRPGHQGLHMWLASTHNRAPARDWESKPLYRRLDAQFTQHHAENPGYTGLHSWRPELENGGSCCGRPPFRCRPEARRQYLYATTDLSHGLDAVMCRHRANLQLGSTCCQRWVLKGKSRSSICPGCADGGLSCPGGARLTTAVG